MNKIIISVIICTHNPKQQYLNRVLCGLIQQTLNHDFWELLLIDNASSESLCEKLDLSWKANSRCIKEPKVGLVNARICGISQAKSNILVFVDDDNVLDENYLDLVLKIALEYKDLGAWGGQTLPGFEESPPAWTERYWSLIGVRTFEKDSISSEIYWPATPIGAGLCIRKDVATKHIQLIQQDVNRLMLGRKANMLLGSEDIDLAYTAIDMGLKIGTFKDLRLHHLIPKSRLSEDYFAKIASGTEFSSIILMYLRDKGIAKLSLSQRLRIYVPWLLNREYWFADRITRKIGSAATQGRLAAMRQILQMN
jgi:glycosyltransferase involved in cell wall biosynthesis